MSKFCCPTLRRDSSFRHHQVTSNPHSNPHDVLTQEMFMHHKYAGSHCKLPNICYATSNVLVYLLEPVSLTKYRIACTYFNIADFQKHVQKLSVLNLKPDRWAELRIDTGIMSIIPLEQRRMCRGRSGDDRCSFPVSNLQSMMFSFGQRSFSNLTMWL